MIRIPNGCVLWLDFTDDTGNIIHDRSGNFNNCTLYNVEMYRELPIKGRYFNGIDAYGTITDHATIKLTSNFTIAVLVYCKKKDVVNMWLRKIEQYNLWQMTSNKIRFSDDIGNGVNSAVVDLKDDWNFIVAVCKGSPGETVSLSKWHIFLNCEDVTKEAEGIWDPRPGYDVNIGINVPPAFYPYNGFIAHVSIYNIPLEIKDIRKLYRDLKIHLLRRVVAASDIRVR